MATLKDKLSRGDITIGSWLSFASPQLCEIMAKAGFDWLVVDMEHTGIAINEMMGLIQLVSLAGCTPLVRVGANDPLLIKRALDSGAAGVVVPTINSANEARQAVDAAYYPPRGKRGVGLSRAQAYGIGFDAYKKWAAEETVVVVQIEHKNALPELEDILAVDGVDAFMIGPYDLSGSYGRPGQLDHPDVVTGLQAIAKVMARSSKAAGIHVVHPDRQALQARLGEGYRFIAYGGDMLFFSHALAGEADFVARLKKRRSNV